MPAPVNTFKQRLLAGERMVGCWVGLCSPYAAELVGHCGFDWLLIDGEHGPNDLQTLVGQLQVIAGTPSDAIVRLPVGEDWMIKQVLDAGAQTLLIPMVHSAEDAARLVRAVRYPPYGVRGVGHALGRASHFGLLDDYQNTANDQMCLIVQAESAASLDALDDILATDGVDAVFVGPADLAADLGHADPYGPEMMQIVCDALTRIKAAGKAGAVIALDDAQLSKFVEAGAQFVAVAVDVLTLSKGLSERASLWKERI